MARRGRFGRAESGASNLSSVIQNLIRQQKAEEERLLLEAFYAGTALFGKIPTIADVTKFYTELADLGGFEEGGIEWETLLQKISQANNFDINRDYLGLVEEFNATNGANYDQLMGFLNGRAKDSTDPENLNTYEQAISSTRSAYIGHQGKALYDGQISIEDFRANTQEVISSIDPSDPLRYEIVTTAYSAEWVSQKNKWDTRLLAGNINVNQYVALVKEFRTSMLANGITKESMLFNNTVEAIVRAKNSYGGDGGSVAKTRITKNTDSLASAYRIAASAVGIGDTADLVELEENPDKVYEYIRNNPEVFLMYDEYLIKNPGAEGALTAIGVDIDSPEDFKNWRERKLDRVEADYAVAGDRDKYLEVNRANRASGRGSVQDDFAFASQERNRMLRDATNPIDQDYIRSQWRAYVNGENSKLFGIIPGGNVQNFALTLAADSEYLYQLYVNEIDLANRQKIGEGIASLSGRYDDVSGEQNIDNDWQYAEETEGESLQLRSGVAAWDPKGQKVIAPPNASFADGVYNQITFGKGPDGSLEPFIQVISGEPLYKTGETGGEPVGHVYDVNGVTIALDGEGNKINAPLNKEFNQYTFSGDAMKAGKAAIIDTSLASTPALFRAVRQKIEQVLLNSASIPNPVKEIIKSDIGEVQRAANLRQAKQLQTLPNLTPQQRRDIYLLQESDVSAWNQFVAPNLDKYEEVRSGVWELKPEFESRTTSTMDPASFQSNALPKVVDIRTAKMKEDEKQKNPLQAIAEFGSTIGTGVNAGMFNFFGGGAPRPELKGPADTFFRNVTPPSVNNQDIIAARVRASNKPVVPIVPQFTPQQVSESFVDFRAGERKPLSIPTKPRFTPEEVEQSLVDFRRGEREMS